MNSQMSPDLFNLIRPRLDSYGFKERKEWLQQGKCPNCDKKELFTHAQSPWVLKCNRLDNCGFEAHAKDLWPELFTDWSKRASFLEESKPKEQQNPNAAADLYLKEGRGFDLSLIKGWYSQQAYVDKETYEGTATVRFPAFHKYWERLIDRPERFKGKKSLFTPGTTFRGLWWQPPSFNDDLLNEIKELWIVEGIFDAIALLHNDIQAVSAMACTNYPSKSLADLEKIRGDKRGITLVWAFDRGAGGEKYLKEFYKQATKDGWTCEAALPPLRKNQPDWNDLHLRRRLQAEHLEHYKYEGALLTAGSAAQKALLIYKKNKRSTFHFDFANQLYYFKIDYSKYVAAKERLIEEDDMSLNEAEEEALQQSSAIDCIAKCNLTALYFQRNTVTDESWYYYQIDFPHGAASVKDTFTSTQLSSASEFKKRLLHIARGAVYTGTSGILDQIIIDQLYNIKQVETIDYIGYSKEHKAYVLGDVAGADGKIITVNKEDYFDLPNKKLLKSLNKSDVLDIEVTAEKYNKNWPELLWQAFGAKGYVALIFWFGSLFAEQVREVHKTWPFNEIAGEAGAGKTTIIEFLWKLVGRSGYEGFDPSKATLAARARNLAQVSNLPVVLIESDRESSSSSTQHIRSFDWDELKTAYNGRSTRARGMATSGNETYEPPFRGAIVISQNNPVLASDAIMQRICHLTFDKSTYTTKTREAAHALETMPMEKVSNFILQAVQSEANTMAIFQENFKEYDAKILSRGLVKDARLAKNHAQIMAMADALAPIINMSSQRLAEVHAYIMDMAAQRQQAISSDCDMVTQFWDIYEYLHMPKSNIYNMNHSNTPHETIAINLSHFYQVAREKNQPLPDMTMLRKVIRTSRKYKFLEMRVVNSALYEMGRSMRCYIFSHNQSRSDDV